MRALLLAALLLLAPSVAWGQPRARTAPIQVAADMVVCLQSTAETVAPYGMGGIPQQVIVTRGAGYLRVFMLDREYHKVDSWIYEEDPVRGPLVVTWLMDETWPYGEPSEEKGRVVDCLLQVYPPR
jgi:hypothetical protein